MFKQWLKNKVNELFGKTHLRPAQSDEYARGATWEDLDHVTSLLDKEGAEYILIGDYALNAHGYARITTDIDILKALSHLPDGVAKAFIQDENPLGIPPGTLRLCDEFVVDLMPSANGHSYAELKQYKTHYQFDDRNIPILNLYGLAKTKYNTVRAKDIADYQVIMSGITQVEEQIAKEFLSKVRDKSETNYNTLLAYYKAGQQFAESHADSPDSVAWVKHEILNNMMDAWNAGKPLPVLKTNKTK